MKNIKRILALVLTLAFAAAACFTLVSCGNSTKTDEKYTVGIVQLVAHPALDAATEGFKQALKDKLGDKVEFDEQNASGDFSLCTTIVGSFVSKKVDLIMANATPALQAAANATLTIPILGTSITEYGVALDIKGFNGTVGGNISGTSDLAPLDEQAQMIIDLIPGVQKVGLLYCSAEANSKYQVDKVKEYLENKGLTATLYPFADSNDIQVVMNKAVTEVDVIYVPTDNTAANSTGVINSISHESGVPVVAGEEGITKGCGTFTLSISYYNIGYKTGEMAAQILTGAAKISEMPIAYDESPVRKYNAENVEFFKLTVPQGYVAVEKD